MRGESSIIGFQKRFFTLGGNFALPAGCTHAGLWGCAGRVRYAHARMGHTGTRQHSVSGKRRFASCQDNGTRAAPPRRRHLRSVVAEVDHRSARQQRRQHKHQSAHVCFPKTVQAARASNEDWRISHRAALAAIVRVSNKDDSKPPSSWYLQPRTTRPPALCQTYQTL